MNIKGCHKTGVTAKAKTEAKSSSNKAATSDGDNNNILVSESGVEVRDPYTSKRFFEMLENSQMDAGVIEAYKKAKRAKGKAREEVTKVINRFMVRCNDTGKHKINNDDPIFK